MQSKNNLIDLLQKFQKSYYFIFKAITLLGILVSLYFSLKKEQQSLWNIRDVLAESISFKNSLLLGLCCVLLFLNWGLEAKKWQVLSRKIEQISYKDAFEAVLVGITLSFVTPVNLGDYAGKIWKLNVKNKLESIGAILLGNGIQFYVSMFWGSASFIYLYYFKFDSSSFITNVLLFIMLFCFVLGLLFFCKPAILADFFKQFKALDVFQKYLKVIKLYTFGDIVQLFLFTTLRYLTFSIQYILLLILFGVNLPMLDIFAVTNMVFYCKTLVPAVNFISDIGVREISSIYFFNLYQINTSKVVLATLLLWLINLLFPAILGFYYILKIKQK
ncbi:MAG: flippase-like domain-containing protein [Pseudarcicella sp.]|nr:flippase-like domain-containing protein [Pseudarcicella sp.]